MSLGLGPMACRLAAYRAGQPPRTASAAAMPDRVSPGATVYRAGWACPGSTRMVPGCMSLGLGPMACRLAAYRAGQPPRTASAAAMRDRVSPGRTAYLGDWAGLPGAGFRPPAMAVVVKVVRVTGVVLIAMRWVAWARAGPAGPAAARMVRMHQASTTHADIVHLRMVVLLSFRWDQ